MTERRWTSGEWIPTATADLSLFVCVGESHDIVATIGTCNKHDACLIAAAPDLYEALEMCVDEIKRMKPEPSLVAVFMSARAALEKARGEDQ